MPYIFYIRNEFYASDELSAKCLLSEGASLDSANPGMDIDIGVEVNALSYSRNQK